MKTFIGNFPGTFAKVRTLKDFVLVNSDRFLKRGMNSFLLAHAVNFANASYSEKLAQEESVIQILVCSSAY